MLRTDAAAAAHIHGAHHQELHTAHVLGVFLRNVRHIGVQLKEFIGFVGAGAFLYQGPHFGDGDNGVHLLLAEPQGQAQVGVRVYIGGQDGTSLRCIEPGQGGREGGFTHAALAGNRYFHGKNLVLQDVTPAQRWKADGFGPGLPRGSKIRCPERPAWPRCARSSDRPASRCRSPRCSWPPPSP